MMQKEDIDRRERLTKNLTDLFTGSVSSFRRVDVFFGQGVVSLQIVEKKKLLVHPIHLLAIYSQFITGFLDNHLQLNYIFVYISTIPFMPFLSI